MDKWLQNITVVRIAALVLGVLLWFVVNIDEQVEPGKPSPKMSSDMIANAAVTMVGFDDELYFIKIMEPTKVNITIRGNQNLLDKVNPEDLQVQVDLSEAVEGSHLLDLVLVGLPAGLEYEIDPENVSLTIEKKQLKEVPITVDLEGEPKKGFIVGIPITTPLKAHVMLASSMLDSVESVRAKVNIDGADSAVTKEVKLVAYDKDGKEVQALIDPAVVQVEVPITVPFKLMPLRIRITGEPQDGYSIASFKQSVDQVSVFGPQDILDKMDFYDGFTVDVSRLINDKLYEVEIKLKDNITLLDPKKVEIDIDVVASETKVISGVTIVMSGLNEDYSAKVTHPQAETIDIRVVGAPNLLDALTKDNIQVIGDVSNMAAGVHEVPLTINLPPFLKVEEGQRNSVTVDIVEKSVEVTAPTPTSTPTSTPTLSGTPTPKPTTKGTGTPTPTAKSPPTLTPTPDDQGATGETPPGEVL